MHGYQKKNLKGASAISRGRAIKKDGSYHLFGDGQITHTPEKTAKLAIQNEIDRGLKSGPVRQVTDRLGSSEKMSPLELKRIKVIRLIKQRPSLRRNSFLNQMLGQRYPLTEAQCDMSLEIIEKISAAVSDKIERLENEKRNG